MGNNQKDFLILIGAFLIMAAAIVIILPVNAKWGYVALLLAGMSGVIQWYWNKHFKN